MRLRYGVHAALDDAATELIRQSLKNVTSREAKSDILTPWKEKDRKTREVYTSSGQADGSLRRGMFHRAWNPAHPHLNARDGQLRARRIPTGLAEFIDQEWPSGAPSWKDNED